MPIIYLTTNLINNRKYIGVDSRNNKYYYGSGKSIKLALIKYGIENFKKETLEENDDINYLYEREKYWIEKYDAINSNEFYNMADGGKGGNMLKSEDSIARWKEGLKKSVQITLEKRKGKTYEEIYGDKANEEKEKRRNSSLGKKFTDDRCLKISNKLKGNVPWNKGLTKEDDRVKKYIKNHKHEEFLKIYELNAPNNIILIFNGKQKLENYIKSVNKNLKFKNKINIDNLIKNKIDKGYTIEIKKIIE